MLEKLKRIVGLKQKDVRVKLNAAIAKVEEHRNELHILRGKLERRLQSLLDVLEKARESGDSVRTTVHASECSELKKVINAVALCEVALTQIIIRFESMRDITEAMRHMHLATTVIKHLNGRETLTPALENIASEATRTLSEALADLSNLSCGISFDLDDSVEKLTEDAERYVEVFAGGLDEGLPPTIQQAKGGSLIKKMQSLAYLTGVKDSVDYGKADSVREERIRRFFKERGEYNIIEAAVTLNLPLNLVEQVALKMISEESRMKIEAEVA